MNKKVALLIFALIFLLSTALGGYLVTPVTASGTIIYVDGSNFGLEDGSEEHPFNSIQEGVDAASPGDTVKVAPWTYSEHVTVDERLILLGEDVTTTIIDGGGSDTVTITADNVSITGFTIQNGCRGILIDNSSGCIISGNTIIHNQDHSIYVWYSNNNTVTGNTMAFNNWAGIFLSSSNNNTVIYNTISNNSVGFGFAHSNNSKIYCNNIMDNTNQVNTWGSLNTDWEGNYWSDYNGTDLNGDGIGETPYIIDGSNQDNYPRINPWPQVFRAIWESTPYDISIVSNSTVTAFSFSQPNKRINFNVTRPSGTHGFCNVTIPETLLGGPYTVTVDDLPAAPSPVEVSNDTHTSVYFTYNHSTRMVKILGTTVIPEFPSATILPLFMIATLLAIIVYKRKHPIAD